MVLVRRALTFLVVGYMVGLLGYGLVRYPDAPIHPCASAGYCGKQGQPHNREEYNRFLTWQSMLEWTWLPGMLVLYILNRGRLRQRRAQGR